MTNYIRVLIQGRLTTHSYLHLGSGEAAPYDDEQSLANQVVRNHQGQIYLPASSLRGYLRSQVKDPQLRQALFGLGRQRSGAAEPGNIGKLRVYDAFLSDAAPGAVEDTGQECEFISRTSIDALTQTAAQHQLATHEVLPPASSFTLKLALDCVAAAELDTLLEALASLNPANPSARLGKSKSIGQGQVSWALDEVRELSLERMKTWLGEPLNADKVTKNKAKKGKAKSNTSEGMKYRSDPGFAETAMQKLTTATQTWTAAYWYSLSFQLHAQSPLLINDPQRVKALEKASEAQAIEQQTPALSYARRDGQAYIPGSSLKGWLRSHCRRILLSLANGQSTVVDDLCDALFGSTAGRGVVQFEDALVNDAGANTYDHVQHFIAIDRFTGGTKHGALYQVEAAWPEHFNGCVHLATARLQDWMKMLLLFALRDAMEGDLVLGWGKSKGFGALRLQQDQIDLAQYPEADVTSWHKALMQKLEEPVNYGVS